MASITLPIEINNPAFWIGLFFLLVIFLFCCYIIYFAFTVRIRKQKHEYFPQVSVLVYAKDAGNTIKRRIENLLKQNYPRKKYEIIVYDNNSGDETEEICREYEKQGKIVYVRAEKPYDRKGPFLDNTIKEYAKGEILLMSDPDVVSEKNWIVDIVQPFVDEKVGAVGGTVHCGNYYKGIVPLMRAIEDEWRFVVPMLRGSNTVFSSGANQALRKEAWEQTKYGTSVIEDVDIATRIMDKGWKSVGISATGVEEEVESLGQYWRQRTRWYKFNINSFLGHKKKWKKFFEALPHLIQAFSIFLMIALIFALIAYSKYLLYFTLLDFILMNAAMIVAFVKIKTGPGFIPFIPVYLTIDAILFVATVIYVQIFDRFFHLTKDVWPSLKGKYYHAGTELREWFFNFEEKLEDYTEKI